MISAIVEGMLLDLAFNKLGEVLHKNKEERFCSTYNPPEPIIKINGIDYMSDVIQSIEYIPPNTRTQGQKGMSQSLLIVSFEKEATIGKNKNIEGKEPSVYIGVPYQLFQDFINSTSKGQFWYRMLANAYPNGELKEIQDMWKKLYDEGKIYACLYNFYNNKLTKIRNTIVSISSKKLLEKRVVGYFITKLNSVFSLGLSKGEINVIKRNIMNPMLTRADDWRFAIDSVLTRKYQKLQQIRKIQKADVKAQLYFGEVGTRTLSGNLNQTAKRAYSIKAKMINADIDRRISRIKSAQQFVKKTRNPFIGVKTFSQFKSVVDRKINIFFRKGLQSRQQTKLGEAAVVSTRGVRSVARKSKAISKSTRKIIKKF